jgi:hypothetical protein
VLDRAVPLGALRPDLPPEIPRLVSDLMEKDRAARPANAEQVVSRLAEIRGMLGEEEVEYEADRETIRANDNRGAINATRWEDFSGRSAVLTPERMARLSGPNTMDAPPWDPAGPPVGPSAPFQAGSPVPAQAGPPERSAPQAASGQGAGTPPEWPAAPARRSRPAWVGVVSTLVTAAIVAGVGAYYWINTHQVLKVTGVRVTAASQKVGCAGTADLIGTITTNAHGGPISYRWVLGNVAEPVLKAADQSGSKTVQVTMKWPFHGKGTGQAVAELDVLTPEQGQSSITFPYSCPQ